MFHFGEVGAFDGEGVRVFDGVVCVGGGEEVEEVTMVFFYKRSAFGDDPFVGVAVCVEVWDLGFFDDAVGFLPVMCGNESVVVGLKLCYFAVVQVNNLNRGGFRGAVKRS